MSISQTIEKPAAVSAHTPGPWEVGKEGDGTPGYVYGNNALGSAVAIVYGPALKYTVFSRAEEEANARLIAAASDLKSVADTIVITGPDADGLVWLQINSPNFPQRAAFNLGSAERLAGQVALKFEEDRRAAIAKAEGR